MNKNKSNSPKDGLTVKRSYRWLAIGLTALAVIIAGCDSDYKNWSDPQSNPQNQSDTTLLPVIKATPAVTATIDFATITDDSIALFTVEPIIIDKEVIAVDTFIVEFAGEGTTKHVSIPASNAGKIAVADLNNAVIVLFGHAGIERLLHTTVAYPVPHNTQEGQVAVKCISDPFDITVKLVPPTIANTYYLFMEGEQARALTKKEEGVFTIVFPGNNGRKDLWFTFIADTYTTFNPQEQKIDIADWDYVHGYGAAEYAMRRRPLNGAFLRRNEQAKKDGKYPDNNFHADGLNPYYRLTVDMMEQTYLIEPLEATGTEPELEIKSEVTSTINLANPTSDSITLFSVVGTPIVNKYDVHITRDGRDTTITLTASAAGKIAVADLTSTVRALYGNAGTVRTLNIQVAERIDVSILEGKYKGTSYAAPFTITAQLEAPFISAHYYLYGTMGDKLEFTRSEEDPNVFTYVFKGNEGGVSNEMWFVWMDEETVNSAKFKGGDWEEVFTYEDDNYDMSANPQVGKYKRRSEIPGGPHNQRSFKVDGTYKYYRVTINVLERTYKIDGVNKRI